MKIFFKFFSYFSFSTQPMLTLLPLNETNHPHILRETIKREVPSVQA